jgi:ABC-2 type transport system permease protein
MTLLIAERALRDRRRGLVGWVLGIGAYVGLMTAMYSAVQGSEIQRAIRSYPKELKAFFGGSGAFDLSTGAGYLNIELFSLVVPALLVIVAIGYGARTIAGEQETGTLELLLANPVTRRRVLLEKVVGLIATLGVLAAVIAVVVVIAGAVEDLGVTIGHVVAACFGALLVALFCGLVAMLVGAATGRRSVAIGVATIVFAASYLIVGLAGLVSWLEPLRIISPLYHANGTEPLVHGLPLGNDLTLVGLCVATLWATVMVFERRDLAR